METFTESSAVGSFSKVHPRYHVCMWHLHMVLQLACSGQPVTKCTLWKYDSCLNNLHLHERISQGIFFLSFCLLKLLLQQVLFCLHFPFLHSSVFCLPKHILGIFCEIECHFYVYLLDQVVHLVAGNMAIGQLYSHLMILIFHLYLTLFCTNMFPWSFDIRTL